MPYDLVSPFAPAGHQPRAIRELAAGLARDDRYQTLLGVTGSGKTMTMAHVIAGFGRPTLVLSHNKTLAAQLYGELKAFFPKSAVEFFISYYDYYQPEAYVPQTDTYIAKDSSINDDIDRLRLRATSSLMEREDVVIVASVSAIYGLGDPEAYRQRLVTASVGEERGRDALLEALVGVQYQRNDTAFERGTFRVRGDTIEVFPAYDEQAVRVEFWGDTVERIAKIDPLTGNTITELARAAVYPATHFVTERPTIERAVAAIRAELKERIDEFRKLVPRILFASATPGEEELKLSGGVVVEQIIRPTGLIDPQVEVRPVKGQVDDLLHEIRLREKKNERVLVTTLTKRMAEDLTDYLQQHGVRVRYLHSEIDAIERVEIIRGLRLAEFDVLVGINLLREGLDLPEVSLVAILDADKEGFLRSATSLIQTAGRAARHINAEVILYADVMTDSIKKFIETTDYRRTKQLAYNKDNHITPKTVKRELQLSLAELTQARDVEASVVRESGGSYRTAELLRELETEMIEAAENLQFEK